MAAPDDEGRRLREWLDGQSDPPPDVFARLARERSEGRPPQSQRDRVFGPVLDPLPAPPAPPPPPAPGRPWRVILLAAASLLVGVGLGYLLLRFPGGPPQATEPRAGSTKPEDSGVILLAANANEYRRLANACRNQAESNPALTPAERDRLRAFADFLLDLADAPARLKDGEEAVGALPEATALKERLKKVLDDPLIKALKSSEPPPKRD